MTLGVLLLLASTAVYNGGILLFVVAARSRADRTGSGLVAAVVAGAAGRLGIAANLLAWALELLALTRLPLTLARALGAAGLGLLLVYARWALREGVGRREVLSVLVIAFGLGLVALFPPRRGAAPPDLGRWLVLLVLLAPALPAVVVHHTRGLPGRPVFGAAAAGLAYAASGMFTNGLAGRLADGRVRPLLLLAAGAAACSLLGFANELAALQRGTVVVVVPVMVAVQTVGPIVAAPAFFAERWPAGIWAAGVLGGGLALILGGAVALARDPDGALTATRTS